MTNLIRRAINAPNAADGRDDTIAQRIADALGIAQNVPESVSQEALAQYRSQSGDTGLLYRTVNDTSSGKTARQIAHELTDHTDSYGWNYGGGRVHGTGLYFVGTGPGSSPGESAAHSAGNYGWNNPYTIEARLKPSARIATDADLRSRTAKQWALNHKRALANAGIRVDASGNTHATGSTRTADVQTTVAMLMGYDGYKESDTRAVYHVVFNLGALQVARGNKFDRANRGSLTR